MNALVLYESMYGNTHRIADAVAVGLRGSGVPADVASANKATVEQIVAADLVVIGAPTHAWSLPRPSTRQAAREAAAKEGSGLLMDPDAGGAGVRELLAAFPASTRSVAVFDTRLKLRGMPSGQAARGIARRLRRAGLRPAAKPAAFFVNRDNILIDGEIARAEAWGSRLAIRLRQRGPQPASDSAQA